MPANMMIDPAGSSLKVIGRRGATVRAGRIPGRTPTAVPRRTPMRAKSRFIGWIATVTPWARAVRASMAVLEASSGEADAVRGDRGEVGRSDQAFDRSHRERKGEKLVEEKKDDHPEREADQEVDEERPPPEGGRCRREQDRG